MARFSPSRGSIPFIAALCVFSGCGGGSQEGRPEAATTQNAALTPPKLPEPTSHQRAFLFKVGLPQNPEKTIFLLGSIHAVKPNIYPLNSVIYEAYASSDSLVVEVNLAGISEEDMAALVLSRAVLKEGEDLRDLLSKDTWQKLKTKLEHYKVNPERFIQFKPWFAGITLVTLRLSEMGYDPALGIDQHFINKGDKEIIELENADSQLALFDELSHEVQELLLVDALEGSIQAGGDLDKVMESWKKGDTAAVNKFLFTSLEQNPRLTPLFQKMIVDRNRTMAQGINKIIEQKNRIFVVVGAGHIVGEEGLVAIFERMGYDVTQMTHK